MELTFYDVITPDGWVLTLWRIRSPNIYDPRLSAPVIISHGFGSSAFDYMWNLRNESTAFVLADNGYDVWLANYRATLFSNSVYLSGKAVPPPPHMYYRAA